MAKTPYQPDLLVAGSHPAGYLAAALLRHKSSLSVVHTTIPEEQPHDRLVLLNPAFFSLHPLLEPLRRKLALRPVYGLHFLSDSNGTTSEYRSKSIVAYIAHLKEIRSSMIELARASGVEFASAKQLAALRVDDTGVQMILGHATMHPKALVLAGRLDPASERVLGIPEEWEQGVVHRYTFACIRGTRCIEFGSRPLLPMSLDLNGTLSWAWLLAGERHIQFAVEQTLPAHGPPQAFLRHWLEVLLKHGLLHHSIELADSHIETIDIPFEGALAHEGLANRTLLVGPAGGFFSGCGEDVYPNCWSAVFAADVLKKALREPHLQDALQTYRHKWRTTLGDYLRGPQRNLRFLLPLVYRNQVMTDRLAEAILSGRSVVR